MGLGGGHTQFHPKAALGLHLPTQLPTPRSPRGAYTLTQVGTHVLTKAVRRLQRRRLQRRRLQVSAEGRQIGETALTPDLGHTPTALSGRTAQVGMGAGGRGRPGAPAHLSSRKAGGVGTPTTALTGKEMLLQVPEAGWGKGGRECTCASGCPQAPLLGRTRQFSAPRWVCPEVFLRCAVSADHPVYHVHPAALLLYLAPTWDVILCV